LEFGFEGAVEDGGEHGVQREGGMDVSGEGASPY